jgi:F-box/leucine-rich repeat protein 2/20
VSTSWNDLAMDGQLWQDCDMHPYLDHMPPSVLIKLLWSSSSCVRKLDTYGWIGLPGASIVNALNGSGAVETSLRTLDLQGCRDLAAKDVKWLLDHSPHLHWVSLKGLTVVDSYLWKSLMQLKSLEYLDVSHCKMSFFSLISHAGMPQTTKITHFLAAGLGCTLEMDLLAGIMPNLQVLDLSHCPTLKDQDILNFVNPPSVDWEPAWRRLEITGRHRSRAGEDIAFLTEEESGQAAPVAWMNFTPRRVTRLKKLALSECTGLTDQACRYLAHAVPQLEVFEMAHADGNPGIRSAGLVAMLSTCTKIRKVDLEGAVEIDEEVLSALTPRATNVKNEVGSCLEVLSIGFADDVSLDAMLQLVRRCPRLRQLDVDVSGLSKPDTYRNVR